MNINESAFRSDSAPPLQNAEYKEIKYNQVGGWLSFFCITLIVIGPLFRMFTIYLNLKNLRDLRGSEPELANFICFDVLLTAGLAVFSLYAGFMLWDLRDNAVNKARAFLIVNLVAAVTEIIAVPFFGFSPTMAEVLFFYAFVGLIFPAVYAAIWLSYLQLSKRVRATYE